MTCQPMDTILVGEMVQADLLKVAREAAINDPNF